jgi:hypothetical protein
MNQTIYQNSHLALTPQDLERLAYRTVPPEIANAPFVGLYRVDSIEGARLLDRKPDFTRNLAGIVITYHDLEGHEREYRIRRDEADRVWKDGKWKEQGKYLATRKRNLPYYPFVIHYLLFIKWLMDSSIPIIFCEGEFKALALMRIALNNLVDEKPPFVVIGLSGVWNFRTKYGNGEGESGLLGDFLTIPFKGRKVSIFYDADVFVNENVGAARSHFSYQLRDELGAQVFFVDMPEDALDSGLKGLDDLAFARGDKAVLDCIENALPAFKPTRPKRETPEEKMKRGAARRVLAEAVAKSAMAPDVETLAKQKLGIRTWRKLAALFAQAGSFKPEERDLLFTLHALGEGEAEVSFYYRDLYRLLYPCDGSEVKDGRLTSSASQKIRRRFKRLTKAEDQCGIQFVKLTPGSRDEDGERVPSSIRLFSYDFVQEVDDLAATDAKPGRNEQATFERAIKLFVQHKKGEPIKRKLEKPRNPSIEIKDGWQRVKGNLHANINRMRKENYYDEAICEDLIRVIPEDLLPVLQAQLRRLSPQKEAENGENSASNRVSKVTPRRPLESTAYDPFLSKNASFDSAESYGAQTARANLSTDDLFDCIFDEVEGIQ